MIAKKLIAKKLIVTNDSKETDSKETDSKENDSKETDSKETDSKETDSKENKIKNDLSIKGSPVISKFKRNFLMNEIKKEGSPLQFYKKSIKIPNTTYLEETIPLPDTMDDSAEIEKNINILLNNQENSSYLADSGCYLTNDEYIRCIYEWSTTTGSSVDWLILDKLLEENWSSFGLFGIEFSNGKALRNAIMTTLGVIASGSALKRVGAFFGFEEV
jgi:hypothetical protein